MALLPPAACRSPCSPSEASIVAVTSGSVSEAPESVHLRILGLGRGEQRRVVFDLFSTFEQKQI
jgi:hypothetical protein